MTIRRSHVAALRHGLVIALLLVLGGSPLAAQRREPIAVQRPDTIVVAAKDPTLAGILSLFIPGLGSAYAGRGGHFLTALVGAIGGTVLYNRDTEKRRAKGDTSVSPIIVIPVIAWLGGILVAIDDAHDANRRGQSP